MDSILIRQILLKGIIACNAYALATIFFLHLRSIYLSPSCNGEMGARMKDKNRNSCKEGSLRE
jgi:hypothetical protein